MTREERIKQIRAILTQASGTSFTPPSIKFITDGLTSEDGIHRRELIHHLLGLENLDSSVIMQIIPLYQAAKIAIGVLEYEVGNKEFDDARQALEAVIEPLKSKLEQSNDNNAKTATD